MLTAQLSLHNVTRRYDDHIVLDAVSFTVKPGEKAGIIGDDGAGKSTLLRLLAGHDRPDNGEVTVVAPDGVGHLAQSLALPPHATVQDAIDLALADLRDLESRMRAAETELHDPAGAELAVRPEPEPEPVPALPLTFLGWPWAISSLRILLWPAWLRIGRDGIAMALAGRRNLRWTDIAKVEIGLFEGRRSVLVYLHGPNTIRRVGSGLMRWPPYYVPRLNAIVFHQLRFLLASRKRLASEFERYGGSAWY